MPRNEKETEGLSLLGNKKTVYKDTYAPEVLETFINKHPDNDYMVTFNCPEFTRLCPITGQPDFAEIKINYIPDIKMVESKSLKLYLFSFRIQGDIHEDCVNIIMKDLVKLMEPKYLEVKGLFTPRGGISIHPFANYGKKGTKYEKLAEERLFSSLPIVCGNINEKSISNPVRRTGQYNVPLLGNKKIRQGKCFGSGI